MKRMNKHVFRGLHRLVSAYQAGAGCEDVGGGFCKGDNCPGCRALNEAAEWIEDRLAKYEKTHGKQ